MRGLRIDRHSGIRALTVLSLASVLGSGAPQAAALELELPPETRDWQRLEALGSQDRAILSKQREAVAALFRQHFGAAPSGERRDLARLQRAVDGRLVSTEQTFELQALGVALGDVMVSELGFEWVAYIDELGRSRALRMPDTDSIVFPVTMISRRVEAGVGVDVDALFGRARQVAEASRPAAAR